MKSIFNHLLIDQHGLLWCGTWGRGLLRFDRHNKKFTGFPWQPAIGEQPISARVSLPVMIRRYGFPRGDEGLLLFDKTTGSFHKVRSPDNPTEVIRAVNSFQSNAHTIWLADQKKLYRYNLDTSRFGWYPVVGTAKGNNLPDGLFNFLLVNGRLYTGGFYKGGFGWYDQTTNRFIQRSCPAYRTVRTYVICRWTKKASSG